MKGRLPAVALSAALLALFASPRTAPAGEDAEARVRALEKRLEEIERRLREKSAEIERLREMVERGRRSRVPERAPEDAEEDRGRDRRRDTDEEIERWRDRIDEMNERMRRDIEDLGIEWGLPGRELRPPRGPITLRPLAPRRAFLGIEMEDAPGGVRVRRVVPDSPAERAGLRVGDVIVELEGVPVTGPEEFAGRVGSKRPGDVVSLTVLRDGGRITLSATLSRPEPEMLRPDVFGFRGPTTLRRIDPFGRLPRDERAGGETIEVETAIPGGTAKASLNVQGLHLSDELARKLGLTGEERREVEAAFERARESLASGVARELAKAGTRIDSAAVEKLRREAEARAREELKGKLPGEKIREIEEAQAEAAAESRLLITVERGTGRGRVEPDAERLVPDLFRGRRGTAPEELIPELLDGEVEEF